MLTGLSLALAAAVLAVLAVAMAWVLGWANRAFHVKVDPRVEAIEHALPGANCGGCGYVGCGDYAAAVAGGKAAVTLCGPGGASCAAALARIMGVEVGETLPYRAVIHCAAPLGQRLKRFGYWGEMSCAAANLVGGTQGCTYGCLGLGDCARACKYGAIHVIDGLARVSYEKCIGCKACSLVCPRNIITMVPFKSARVLVVACSNKDFAKDVRDVCNVGCIGCKACVKKGDLFLMNGNLPVIDYATYNPEADFQTVLDKCTRELLLFVGTPTAEDIAATKEEELPARVVADFKTTIDKLKWWG